MPLQKVRKMIKMPLKSLFLCCKFSNIVQWLGAPRPRPLSETRSSCISLFSTRPKLDNFCAKIICVPPLFSKILVARLAAFTVANRVFKRLRQGRNSGGARRGGAPQTKISPAQIPKRQ